MTQDGKLCPSLPASLAMKDNRVNATRSLTLIAALGAWAGTSIALAASPGSVLVWGRAYEGQTAVPDAAQSGVTAIAEGLFFNVALKSDGSVLAWGSYAYGQTTVPLVAQSGVIAIAAGRYFTVALKNDGSVVAWGRNDYGQTTVPVAAQSGVTAISAGYAHTVA